ncbi:MULTISPECIES: type IV secretory system conjugative DNA transfer family protein [unclassified Thioalkalivibrio]|uniref:type IV secretory system conjugative DNA transfer family protein n=1 Tax=unclassified Thioalkalivibrio TaxID=2621013 RepID=UPI001E31F5F1|nr:MULTISPECIES: hypothetical protein [unclassified Thioalkalivibrio]
MGIVVGMFGLFGLFIPGVAPLSLLLFGLLFWWHFARLVELPFFLPASSGLRKDPHDLKAGSGKMGPASGIYFFGRGHYTDEEIWFTNNALRQHLLFLATTGGGKTASLTSLMWNPLIQGSGFVFVDGKADLDVAVRIMSLAHRVGRADDVLVVNYLTGNVDAWSLPDSQITNTFNFMSRGSSSAIIEILRSLVDADKDIWGKRAEAAVSAFVTPLVYQRDSQGKHLTVDIIRENLELDKVAKIVRDESIPMVARAELTAYLKTLPGLKEEEIDALAQGAQVNNPTAFEQHGYVTMQLVPALNELSGRFGHIFNARMSEVDMEDVVLRNRILIVLLPALEKSENSLANLGRIVVASLKSMMASSLGSVLEGDVHDNLENRPTASSVPFPAIFDEVGYYFVSGMAVAAAQARSIGFQVIYAAQDVPAMKRLGDKAARETASVIGNTNIKIVGRLEEFEETVKVFKERAGEGYFGENTSLQRNEDGAGDYYESGANVTRRNRLDPRDLAVLDEGQVFINFKDTLIRVDMFYANPKLIRFVQLTRGLEIDSPSETEIERIKDSGKKATRTFMEILKEKVDPARKVEAHHDKKAIESVASLIAQARSNGAGPLESVLAAMRGFAFEDERAASALEALKGSDDISDRAAENIRALRQEEQADEAAGGNRFRDIEGEPLDESEGGSLGDQLDEISSADGSEDPFGGDVYEGFGPESDDDDPEEDDLIGVRGRVEEMGAADDAYSEAKEHFGDIFGSGLIDRDSLTSSLARVNEYAGMEKGAAEKSARGATERLSQATRYPTDPTPDHDPDVVVDIIGQILETMDDDDGDSAGGDFAPRSGRVSEEELEEDGRGFY